MKQLGETLISCDEKTLPATRFLSQAFDVAKLQPHCAIGQWYHKWVNVLADSAKHIYTNTSNCTHANAERSRQRPKRLSRHTNTAISPLEWSSSRLLWDKAQRESQGMRAFTSKPARLIVIIARGCTEMHNVAHHSQHGCMISLMCVHVWNVSIHPSIHPV